MIRACPGGESFAGIEQDTSRLKRNMALFATAPAAARMVANVRPSNWRLVIGWPMRLRFSAAFRQRGRENRARVMSSSSRGQ